MSNYPLSPAVRSAAPVFHSESNRHRISQAGFAVPVWSLVPGTSESPIAYFQKTFQILRTRKLWRLQFGKWKINFVFENKIKVDRCQSHRANRICARESAEKGESIINCELLSKWYRTRVVDARGKDDGDWETTFLGYHSELTGRITIHLRSKFSAWRTPQRYWIPVPVTRSEDDVRHILWCVTRVGTCNCFANELN